MFSGAGLLTNFNSGWKKSLSNTVNIVLLKRKHFNLFKSLTSFKKKITSCIWLKSNLSVTRLRCSYEGYFVFGSEMSGGGEAEFEGELSGTVCRSEKPQ